MRIDENNFDKKATPTEEINIIDNDGIEDELRQMSKEDLIYRLKYVETDPDIIKLIKKVLKTKA